MLESMTSSPRPTRAEVSDVANAVYDRTGAIMLSGESAMGKHPDLCVNTMTRISHAVETDVSYWKRFKGKEIDLNSQDLEMHIAYIAVATAKNLKANAIVAYTHTGDSARRLAGMGPECPIFAITDNAKTYQQLSLSWNVFPVLVEGNNSIDATIEAGIEKLKENTLEKGDIVVISGGAKTVNSNGENKVIDGVLRI